MKTSWAFNLFLFLITVTQLTAQYKLTGTVQAQQDSTAVSECVIYLNDGKKTAISDAKGHFVFTHLEKGNYTLHIVTPDHKYVKQDVMIENANMHVSVIIDTYSKTLDDVIISTKGNEFGFARMAAVESMGIYEGKKTEVILPDKLVANTAANNARQLYSRVAGLNIWESDAAGLQLGIGGRGLDPNRTANFNVRQNGYDISADALGYPESYYTPPAEAVERIEIVRGAASLQYGTQFGGLINFVMKKPPVSKKIELTARQTLGSYGFYNAFTSLGGTVGKLSYYTFFQYKTGKGWRTNSDFDIKTGYVNVNYQLTAKSRIGLDYTYLGYLAQQPGGLSDEMFRRDPRQSNRERNWFKVDWNLWAIHFTHKFNTRNEFNIRLFGLSASRYSVGFRPNRVDTRDDNGPRDLIKGDFLNWGAEARYMKHYNMAGLPAVLLLGSRYYHGFNRSQQGSGSAGKGADFDFVSPETLVIHDYSFPNRNTSVFAENIFYLHEKLSVTPGIRYEHINTRADGYYKNNLTDFSGAIYYSTTTNEQRRNVREFVIAGTGISYKPFTHLNLYTNISQNYRSITFSDMRIVNPSQVIDPDMKDERGYSFDAGVRSEQTALFNFDISGFYLSYNNRIGEVQFYDERNRVLRKRTNIGQAVISGVESYAEADVLKLLLPDSTKFTGIIFLNAAYISSVYKKSEIKAIEGKKVEFVPDVNLKTGLTAGYGRFKASWQFTYLSDQYTDATNAVVGGFSAVIGRIPAYHIMDLSMGYEFKWFRLEGSVNNLTDQMYFTRRATAYPGPGILPSSGRTFYLTLQFKI